MLLFESSGKMAKRQCVRVDCDPIIQIKNITDLGTTVSTKLKRVEHVRSLELSHTLSEHADDIWVIYTEIDDAWRNVLNEIIIDADDEDIITGYIENHQLARDIWIAPKRKCDLRYDEFLNAIGTVTQSNKAFLLDGQLTVRVGIVKARAGASRKAPISMYERSKKKRSVLIINGEKEVSCFWLAVVTAKVWQTEPDSVKKNYRRSLLSTNHAKHLAARFGVPPYAPVKFRDIPEICGN